MLHRNSQKRDYTDNNIYFIVTKTFKNFPYFKEPIFCELLIEELKLCKEIKEFKLYGFCIIYDHLNLMIHPNDKFNVSKIMQFLKRHFSRNANYIISDNGNEIDFEFGGDIGQCRLQIQNQFQSDKYNKFANTIELFNKKINNFHNQFTQKYGKNQIIIPKFKWQKSYHDHIIRNAKDFENHCHYTVYNFQKHNLPESWKYTSLNYDGMIDGIEL